MKVLISAGGTGGHIYPALAIINKIKEKEPNSEFLYIGTHNRMEKDIIPNKGIPFVPIEIYGVNRRNILKNFKTIKCFFSSIKKCKKVIKEFNPDVVIGVGGYVTGPVIYSAKKLGCKTFIHEQNSIAGKANLFLAKYADKIGVSFQSTKKEFPENKTIFTGNPCSEDAIKQEKFSKKEFGLDEDKKLVYIVMGSLGSAKISEYLEKSMNKFQNKNYQVLFVTGKVTYEEVSKNKFPENVFILPYIENQVGMLKNADLVVTRCGASTLSEIIALEKPSILIPSPYVTNNHQYKNAMDLVNNDAAILLEEKDLKGDILVNKIDEVINNQERLNQISNNLKPLAIKNSATKIYEILKEMVE